MIPTCLAGAKDSGSCTTASFSPPRTQWVKVKLHKLFGKDLKLKDRAELSI